jgi:Methylamine utilisation protein MauE.
MRNVLRWLLVVGLAGVLAWSGLAKVADPVAFASAVLGFRIVDGNVVWVVAYYLPWLELVTAAALLTPRWTRGALLLSMMLFGGFALIWSITWVRGLNPECGCFGSGEGVPVALSLLRSVMLALLAVWALILGSPSSRSARHWFSSLQRMRPPGVPLKRS